MRTSWPASRNRVACVVSFVKPTNLILSYLSKDCQHVPRQMHRYICMRMHMCMRMCMCMCMSRAFECCICMLHVHVHVHVYMLLHTRTELVVVTCMHVASIPVIWLCTVVRWWHN